MMISGLCRRAARASTTRSFATRRKTAMAPLMLDNLPSYEVNDPTPIPGAPVTSAHCIDLGKKTLSTLDSVAVDPKGQVVHGRYGALGAAAEAIPLEYLALLRPAAEGAAALRVTVEKSKHKGPGTLLVYGASTAQGLATVQLASAAGHAVVGVVGAEHSGNDTLMEALKGMVAEPGTIVGEEYAISKKGFADLVASISSGDEGVTECSPEEYLAAFKANFIDYCAAYPDTRPAAVGEEHLEFKYMEKDREFFEQNMEAFLEQYPPGAPPVDKAKLDAYFASEQYEIFRNKFWEQTTGVISGDDTPFSAPHIVKSLIEAPEMIDHRTYPGAGPTVPYTFSILNPSFPPGTEAPAGGPIHGAIVVANAALQSAAAKVAEAKTKRAKGEALQFLTKAQRAAFSAACSVVAQATKAGAPVVCVGQLPGLTSVSATEADVKEALAAMDIDEAGNTRLNYFVQVYRANDFAFYADYAVHKASEPLAGPRQIIVTK